ncbi:hypothetical protein TSAR_007977 [Trichomalopsis sarcophagae]|uniref:Uncharacterized protein n=1 Tax=Trichomalopsis sarcophagae TaxID=543379 RepID=A0A232FNP2_9HYME|nr:hypothetical protein TSAR_007977 [Trichomalopsis sarcophagae]
MIQKKIPIVTVREFCWLISIFSELNYSF